MNIKKLLRLYPTIPQSIQKLNKELNEWIANKRETRDTLKAATITDMPRAPGLSDKTYNAVEKIVDRYEERIEQLILDITYYMDIKEDIENALKDLEPIEKRIIELRYFSECSFDMIPFQINMARAPMFRLHKRAMQKIEQSFTDSKKAAI